MSDRPVHRAAAASGAIAFALVLAGLILSVAAGRPETTMSSSPAEVVAALAEPAGAGVWIGVALEAAGVAALLLFAAILTGAVRGRDAGRDALARAGFGCAAAFAAVSFAALVLGGLVGDLAGGTVDEATAVLLNDLWGGLYAASWAPYGAFLVLAGAALWRTGVLPQAMVVAALVVGILSFGAIAAPASSAGQAIGFLPWLWATAASVVLLRRPERAMRHARAVAP